MSVTKCSQPAISCTYRSIFIGWVRRQTICSRGKPDLSMVRVDLTVLHKHQVVVYSSITLRLPRPHCTSAARLLLVISTALRSPHARKYFAVLSVRTTYEVSMICITTQEHWTMANNESPSPTDRRQKDSNSS